MAIKGRYNYKNSPAILQIKWMSHIVLYEELEIVPSNTYGVFAKQFQLFMEMESLLYTFFRKIH